MKSWKLALVGLATVSSSAFAVPVQTGAAVAATTSAELVSIPDLGGEKIVVVTDLTTGEIFAKAADGTLVPATATTAAQVQKVCGGYGCPGGGPYYAPGSGYLGYGGGPGYAPAQVYSSQRYMEREYDRSYVDPYTGAYVNERGRIQREQGQTVVVPPQPYGPVYGGGYGGGYGPYGY